MIQNTDKPEVIHDGTPIRRIDMSEMDAESIKVMLENSRDGFYSNKELAPIREYSTNAADAHIEAGISTRPIEITLPSQLQPELRIRDFGKGLSLDQLSDIYFKYWKSTKRNTNELNGTLGIGAKSAFAYSPVYTVISICDGMKIVATGQRNGFADVIYHQPNANNEENGIEVIIPIQEKDIAKFIHEATEFFKYWDVRPIFHNIDDGVLREAFNIMDTTPFLSGEGWSVRPAGYGKGSSKAIMSKVPYTIDWEQVKNSLTPEIANKVVGIFTFLEENLTTLSFANGTLAFTPNREALQYNEFTVKVLGEKLVLIYESLLNIITSKVSEASNLWEAKIRYNQIFRRELDGFDKAFAYGGNLNTLESLLRNRVQWNGITITNGYFEGLDEWDVTIGKVQSRYNVDNFSGILTTYVKNGDRTGVKAVTRSRRRRWSSGNDKIIASPKSVVIIQDTDKNFLAKGLARYFLYKSNKDIQQVYILDLSNPTVKDAFFKEYNFDTVPVSFVSQNELLIKAYLKSIRAPRGTNEGVERESRPLYCPFVEIKNRKTHSYLSLPTWGNESVNARGIDGGFYVVYSKNSFTYNGNEIFHCDSENFWQAIYDLSEISGNKLTKVFGIHPKTAESVWFKEAVEEGHWTNLYDWVNENIGILDKSTIKKVSAYDSSFGRVGTGIAEVLSPLLVNKDGVAAKYFNEIADFKNHFNTKNIPLNLHIQGFGCDEAERTFIDKLNSEMKTKYPLMFRIASEFAISDYKNVGDDDFVKELANYINLMDVYA